MLCLILENGSSIWDPYTDKLQEELVKVQNRAARFVTRNYVYITGSMTGVLGQLESPFVCACPYSLSIGLSGMTLYYPVQDKTTT